MAHYAFLDENSIVVEVIVGRNENEVVDGISDWESHYAEFRPGLTCKRTSYNNNFRKNYAGIGYLYDSTRDIFLPPQPYPSWILDEEFNWITPVPKPDSGFWVWNEELLRWEEQER